MRKLYVWLDLIREILYFGVIGGLSAILGCILFLIAPKIQRTMEDVLKAALELNFRGRAYWDNATDLI